MDRTGRHMAGLGTPGHGRAGQGRPGRHMAGLGTPGHGRARQARAGRTGEEGWSEGLGIALLYRLTAPA